MFSEQSSAPRILVPAVHSTCDRPLPHLARSTTHSKVVYSIQDSRKRVRDTPNTSGHELTD